MATLETGNSGMRFEDVNGDGVDEIITADDTFAYWNTCFACSPKPKVIARWNGTSIVLAEELMRTDLDGAALAKHANEMNSAWTGQTDLGSNGVHVTTWTNLLELIYTGRADIGFELLAQTWSPDGPDRTKFEQEFLNLLAHSAWAENLASMNGGSFALRLQAERAAIAAADQR